MAKDGINFRVLNGKQADIILGMLDINVSSRIINSSLKKAGEAVEAKVKQSTPVSKAGTKGNKLASRNHSKGTLRRSIKYGLRTRARPNANTFIASVYAQDGRKNKAPNDSDGWYSHMVVEGRKGKTRPKGKGSLGSYNKEGYMKRGARKAKGRFKSIMTLELSKKLTRALQRKLKKMG